MNLSKQTSFLFLLVLLSIDIFSSDTLNFVSPVDHVIKLTGNFMEIRSNHFHSGIDIKSSKGVIGDNIKSVHDGFVSRIKIQSGSYGQSLYIDHPNGYTSVYAHLDKFIPEIENYIKDIQYTLESFEVDIYLPDGLIQVEQGQSIGIMGNKGMSFGPHLHFELRETKTERPVNPELLGIGPDDNVDPVIQSLSIYALSKDGNVLRTQELAVNKVAGQYHLKKNQILAQHSRVGIGIKAYDQMNGSWNKNGVYKLEMFVDDSIHYQWQAQQYRFEEAKKINGFIDFSAMVNKGQKVYKLYEPHCSGMNSIDSNNNGVIDLEDNSSKNILIRATDIFGNSSDIQLNLRANFKAEKEEVSNFSCDKTYSYKAGMFTVEFPMGCLFEPLSQSINADTSEVNGQKCHHVQIARRDQAVSGYFRISTPIPNNYRRSWTFISRVNNKLVTYGADTTSNQMYAYVNQLGDYYTYKDVVAPEIKIINLEPTMDKPWKLLITDNLIPVGREPDLYFEAKVNGKWICMEYDLKNDMLIFDDFDRISKEEIIFEIEVGDNQGNLSSLKRKIR